MKGPIDVVISVDVEFNVNDALVKHDRKPIGENWVYGHQAADAHGLEFLLDVLDRYGLKGTFFTEIFNVHYFGDAPIQRVIDMMLRRGQDVQMHLHQVWLYYHYASLRAQLASLAQPDDQFYGWDVPLLTEWLNMGKEIFTRLVGNPPLALRTGALTADGNLYRAMQDVGLKLSSNLGVAVMPAREADLCLYSGIHRISGVTEVPVTSYADAFSKKPGRLLTLAGSTFAETRTLLERAARRAVSPLVILVHPHDFLGNVNKHGADRFEFTPDTLRKSRFERLCRYLSERPNLYRVVTFAQAGGRWQEQPGERNELLNASIAGFLARAAENVILPKAKAFLSH